MRCGCYFLGNAPARASQPDRLPHASKGIGLVCRDQGYKLPQPLDSVDTGYRTLQEVYDRYQHEQSRDDKTMSCSGLWEDDPTRHVYFAAHV